MTANFSTLVASFACLGLCSCEISDARKDRNHLEACYAAGLLSREDYTLHRYIVASREENEARERAAAQVPAAEANFPSNDTTNDDCHRRRSEKDCPKRDAEHCKEHRR